MDMWRKPRKHLQSGDVDHSRWSGRSAKWPLLSAPFANSAVYCNFTNWLGNKIQARMNHPHPLRRIKGHVCFSILLNGRGIVHHCGASFFTPCRHEKWSQRSKYRVLVHREEVHAWDWELACYAPQTVNTEGGRLGRKKLRLYQTLIPVGALYRVINTYLT